MAKLPKGVTLTVKSAGPAARVVTPEAAGFVASLHRGFRGRRHSLLAERTERYESFTRGILPDFPSETSSIRLGAWRVAPIPRDLEDQRTGIICSTGRKAILAGFNSGARQCIVDFEDLTSPTWDNVIEGQVNLMDRWSGAMEYIDPATGKRMALARKPATLLVRPRGFHLDETHLQVDGEPVIASLFDAGLYLFHNARTSIAKGSGPYLCLPKLENRHEARLWSDILIQAQSLLSLPVGSIRATAMIETLPAVFEMDEIIYELRDQITALSYGALNQAFSLIRSLDSRKSQIFSDRDSIESYHHAVSEVLIKTAHLRSCLALGAMATEVPDREDVEANQRAMSALKSKAERAVRAGCDGMWVTHRGSVATAMSIFDNDLPTPNQLYVTRDDVNIARDILLAPPPGRPSEAEFRDNIRVAVQFIETWLSGRGSLIVDGRREDTASVELRRGQIWQWIHHRVKLDTRQKVSSAMFETTLGDVLKFIKADIGNDAWRDGRYREAAALLKTLSTAAVLDPAFSKRASRKLS